MESIVVVRIAPNGSCCQMVYIHGAHRFDISAPSLRGCPESVAPSSFGDVEFAADRDLRSGKIIDFRWVAPANKRRYHHTGQRDTVRRRRGGLHSRRPRHRRV